MSRKTPGDSRQTAIDAENIPLLSAWKQLAATSVEASIAGRPDLFQFSNNPLSPLHRCVRIGDLSIPSYTGAHQWASAPILPNDQTAFARVLDALDQSHVQATKDAPDTSDQPSSPPTDTSPPADEPTAEGTELGAPLDPIPALPQQLPPDEPTVLVPKTIGALYIAMSPVPREFTIGIALLPRHRGRGHALRACAIATQWAIESLGAHRVQARILAGTPTTRHAVRLFSALGFTHEGVQRGAVVGPDGAWADVTHMGVLDTDWIVRAEHGAAPSRLWDQLFERHQLEREDLLRWEEAQAGLRPPRRRGSMDTIRAVDVGDMSDADTDMESEMSTGTRSTRSSSTVPSRASSRAEMASYAASLSEILEEAWRHRAGSQEDPFSDEEWVDFASWSSYGTIASTSSSERSLVNHLEETDLYTDRAELRAFASPDEVPGGYAILSHVWESDEQSFQQVQAFQLQATLISGNPRDLVSPKIRACCLLAERHDHKWESSAEVSDAVNSMFLFYASADVCYAYMRDVPGGYFSELFFSMCNSPFRHSAWHFRGWTLQELLAPGLVLFLSQDWTVLGSKADLAELLEDITRIPVDVLRMQRELSSVSIARRMSWAATRKTTRIEDEAYSLMGIFGVNMPVLYGEGKEAFRRLQEEIMKHSVDTSLFAWGTGAFTETEIATAQHTVLPSASCAMHDDPARYLLAPSVSCFADCHKVEWRAPVTQVPPDPSGMQLDMPSSNWIGFPTFTHSPHGILGHVPVLPLPSGPVAVIFCTVDEDTLLLPMYPCPKAPDPSRPLYHTGPPECRLVRAGTAALQGVTISPHAFKRLYFAHRPTSCAPRVPRTLALVNGAAFAPFRISQATLRALAAQNTRFVAATDVPFPWAGAPPLALALCAPARKYFWVLALGRCEARKRVPDPSRQPVGGGKRAGPHWASIQQCNYEYNRMPTGTCADMHSCETDHVADWPEGKKTFTGYNPGWIPIDLVFSPCPMNPTGETLVLHIDVRKVRAAGPPSV
ncbi:uncharacterized protein BXZ73DRAFT_100612 [Epithele typhae]|uniref:uncharacterized protein n=1 Tax=Epithele typhae TaxID=378194 RepID=UPI002007B427|nr:uncharacterized protein BXZ73DRAFT_100612 [Epithele typhae]KAH9935227.1 hypothetical protein BXZ73DRAFT_100612 [Epithele typhae]